MINEAAFAAEFELQRCTGGTYGRTIGAHWSNKSNRIFGGYSAALALNAAIAAAPFRRLCSAHAIFLDPVLEGDIVFEVATLKAGRSLVAMRVTGSQHNRPVLTAQVWLRAPIEAPVSGEIRSSEPKPEQAVDLSWLAEAYPFHRFLQCRAIDYPSSARDLFEGDGRRTVDIWSRPNVTSFSSQSLTQLFDVLVADAFASDPQVRMKDVDPGRLVSLDLSIQWSPWPGQSGWRRLQGWAPPAGAGLSSCLATIFDERMNVCASVAQQTWTVGAHRTPR